MWAATLLLGPCPNLACKRPRIMPHADRFAARHVLGKTPQWAARVQGVAAMHRACPPLLPRALLATTCDARPCTTAPSRGGCRACSLSHSHPLCLFLTLARCGRRRHEWPGRAHCYRRPTPPRILLAQATFLGRVQARAVHAAATRSPGRASVLPPQQSHHCAP